MTNLICKYPLEIADEQTLQLPHDAEILDVIEQNNQLVLYVVSNKDNANDLEPRKFLIIETYIPFEFNPNLRYINSVKQYSYVWHVFEELLED